MIGLGLLLTLWLVAWKFRRSPPLPGLVLLALNGTVIVFGDSMRAHGLGSLLILLTVAAAGWFLKNPSWLRAAGWAVIAILSVQTLFQNAVFIAAICAGAWAVCVRRKTRPGRAAKFWWSVWRRRFRCFRICHAFHGHAGGGLGHCARESRPAEFRPHSMTRWDIQWNNAAGSGSFLR